MKRFPLSFARHLVPVAVLLGLLAAPLAQAAPYAYVVNHGSDTVSVIDTATDAVVATVPIGSTPFGVAVSPDGRRVYLTNECASSSNCNNGTVSVIDTATNTVTAIVPVGNGPLGVAASPDGSRVYVANSTDGTVSVIDTATNTVTAIVPAGNGPIGVAVTPDGARVYVTNIGSNTVSVIDAATDTVTATVPVGNSPYGPIGVAVSPDGRRVYVVNQCATSACSNGSVSMIDTATDTVTATVPVVGVGPAGVAVSPDGRQVYVVNGTNSVSVIDTATNTVTAIVPVGNGPLGVAASPDGSRVYVTNSTDGTVTVIDAATDATVGSPIGVGTQPVSIGAFVGRGALIAANSSASGGAGSQISGSVPALTNNTSPTCATSDATVQGPAQGSLTFDASTGAYTYTPASATYSGPDAFTWRGQAPGCTAANAPINPVSDTATVSLTLDPLLIGLVNVTLSEGGSAEETFSLIGSKPFTHALAASDNATVLPPAGVTVTPADCVVAPLRPCTLSFMAASTPGTAGVTVSATDKYGDTVTKRITVTVRSNTSSGGGGTSTLLGLLALAGLLGLAGLRRHAVRRRS